MKQEENKQPDIERLKQDIEITHAFLLADNLTKEQWDCYVRQYHYLNIKLAQVKGDRVVCSGKVEL